MRHYCTYFDRNYLCKAIALAESLQRHEKSEFRLYAVCLDEISRLILNRLKLPNVVVIPLHAIEQGDEPLWEARKGRSLLEYYFTITPTVIIRLISEYPEIDVLTYLDADLYFFSSPDPLFEELGPHSIMIQEHRFSPRNRHREQWGKYNVGWISFRNDASGLEAVHWWREKCIEWCYARIEDGKFADQLYLDDWPARFDGVVVTQNHGAGVAPWNHDQYSFAADGREGVIIDGSPLVFFHFHALSIKNPSVIVAEKIGYYLISEPVLKLCYLPYAYALTRAMDKAVSVLPGFSFGIEESLVISPAHSFLAKKAAPASHLNGSGLTQTRISADGNWDIHLGLKPEDVMTHYEGLMAPGGPDPVSYGEKLFEEGKIEEACLSFQRAIDANIEPWAAHNNLGVIYWQTGAHEKSAVHFAKSVGLDPFYRPAVINYAQVLAKMDRKQDAAAVCAAYLQKYPSDQEIIELNKGILSPPT